MDIRKNKKGLRFIQCPATSDGTCGLVCEEDIHIYIYIYIYIYMYLFSFDETIIRIGMQAKQ